MGSGKLWASVLLPMWLVVAGCDAGEIESAQDEAQGSFDKADTAGIDPKKREAKAILALANSASHDVLLYEVQLSDLAATNIVSYRLGDDGVEGTEDDARFSSLLALDKVPFVGPIAFGKLRAYAKAHLTELLPGPCPGLELVGALADVTRAPRQNAVAEYLALELGGGLVAEETLYLRVVKDLAAIAAAQPGLDIKHALSWNTGLTLDVPNAQRAVLRTGGDADLNCINAYYGTYLANSPSLRIMQPPGRRYDERELISVYEQLPSVSRTFMSTRPVPYHADICVSAEGTLHSYIVAEVPAGCPYDCNPMRYTGLSVTVEGVVTILGSFELDRSVTPEAVVPQWFTALAACRASL